MKLPLKGGVLFWKGGLKTAEEDWWNIQTMLCVKFRILKQESISRIVLNLSCLQPSLILNNNVLGTLYLQISYFSGPSTIELKWKIYNRSFWKRKGFNLSTDINADPDADIALFRNVEKAGGKIGYLIQQSLNSGGGEV